MARILLADDSEIVLQLIGGRLTAEGFDVVSCLSGTEAIAHATQRGPFDLIILDVMMPDLTGLEVTRKLRREPSCSNTPVLLLTSLDGTEDKVNGLESGADDFLTKTVSDAELVARVRSLVTIRRLRQQSEARATAATMLAERHAPTDRVEPHLYVVHDDPEVREQLLSVCRNDRELAPQTTDVAAELAHLTRVAPDLVLISFQRALEGALPLSEMMLEWASPPAILVLDPQPSADRRIAAYQQGAEDYIVQGTPEQEIAARVASALRRRQRYRSVESARDRALEAAITDQLTGLYNRGYFDEVLRGECKRALRYGQPAAVVLLDIDHFKQVNDTWGHGAGDGVLREVSRRVTRTIRSSDLAARYGGEEFIFLLPSTNAADAQIVADRLRVALEESPFEVGTERILVTASLGMSVTTTDGTDARRLIELADEALYAAKRGGRNQVVTSGRREGAPAVPAARCHLCDAVDLVAGLLAEDLENPLAAVRMAAQLAPNVADESTNVILCGVRDGADAVLERLTQLEVALNEASREHVCPRLHGPVR
ncbi:MAG: diguanylate cyclase [Archangium sp.]|nr:diguanylate cyclase [Archangium sp.]